MCAPERCPPYDSSPLTRGKRAGNRVGKLVPGLIPAHAGKTSCSWCLPPYVRAHPRVGGDNVTALDGSPFTRGSSPRRRGKHEPAGVAACDDGLIPVGRGRRRF